MAKMPMSISPEEVARLSEDTEGYSGADLENLCREAALICLRQDIQNKEVSTFMQKLSNRKTGHDKIGELPA